MKSITFFKTLIFLLFTFCFAACGNGEKPETGSTQTKEAQTDNAAPTDLDAPDGQAQGMDPGFMAALPAAYSNLLQGKWYSVSDPNYAIVFSGDNMTHTHSGKKVSESKIEIDPLCEKAGCKGMLGWCFIEKTGKDNQCVAVLQADAANLIYKVAGTAGGDLAFKKSKLGG